MPWSCLHCSLILGCVMLMLVSCDSSTLDTDTEVLATSFHPGLPSQSADLAAQDRMISLDPDAPAVLGLTGNSQESGFASEEVEETRPLQSQYFWDEGGEINSSSLDPYSPDESPASLHPSALAPSPGVETPGSRTSSSPLGPPGESLDPDLWEVQGESSGSPLVPGYGLTTTDMVPLTHTTSKGMGAVPVHLGDHSAGHGTALPDEAGAAEAEPQGGPHADDSVPPTTLISNDNAQQESHPADQNVEEHKPTDLTALYQGGVEGSQDSSVQDNPLATISSSSPSSSSSSSPHAVAFTDIPWHKAIPTASQGQEPQLRQGQTEFSSEMDFQNKHQPRDSLQVICVDWRDLSGKGYVILNMSKNFDCDEFRMESGDRLLEMLETAFSRKMNSPQGSWLISLSKPSSQDRQLLMTLASEHGEIPTKDVLPMLGEIRRGLNDIGIQDYTSVTSCQSRPSQTRSDYGKLFVVLVIIGSVCVLIIASGLIYICWQRRPPKMKNMSRGEELHFVENGCHDNPTLDVTSDSQSEMLEKKHSANGVMAGDDSGNSWQVLVNKAGKEEAESLEEDTHL
ncbi:hypothetical protein AGOR_G00067710 [Albula goreensis]|uniref:Podocalyxin-like protein 2 n=1 Tax=Albula goreensis TaxID=1534307 RepID=A0A8T3DUF6_9TELE|nr:hypothetical protein AGOR_G00067710 [Albula goreensis]